MNKTFNCFDVIVTGCWKIFSRRKQITLITVYKSSILGTIAGFRGLNFNMLNIFQCCGCFGQIGGTDDYCNPDCSSKNKGTVIKQIYTWFWVRTSLPQKVWKRCMDYKVENENGDTIWYRLLDGSTIPKKV